MGRILQISLVLCYCTLTMSENPAAAIFTAVAPKEIFPFSKYKISIGVEGDSSAKISAMLTSADNSFSANEVEIPGGTSKVLELEVKELPEESYNLTIKSESAGIKSEDVTLVFVDRRERSLLIQTDKPIYKPAETVKFRVVVLDRYFKPLATEQTIQLKVLDPQRNVIKIWKDLKVSRGLYSSSLELSSEPNLGDWTLEVKAGDETDSQTFEVAQYVLPKFKVDVKLPPFVSFNQSNIRVEVKATYTYGKGLKGECTVKLQRKGYYYTPYGQPKKILSKTMPLDGSATLEFDTVKEEFGLKDASSIYSEIEFEVQATVRDAVTGREQNGSATVKLHKYPYKIELIDKANSIQPGLPFEMKFKVSSQDDVPIEDASPKALTVEHGFSYNAEDSVVTSALPSNGIVKFTFTAPSNELLYISNVEATYKDLKQQFYLPQKVRSDSKTYIQLTSKTETPVVNQDMDLVLKATKKFSSFNYVIYGRGLVHESGRILLPAEAKEHAFKLKIPQGATPEGKIVVYTPFKPSNEILADSITFSAGSVLQNKLNLSLSTGSAEPGANVTISLQTKPNSLVALRGVDQSVLLLKEDKDINAAAIDAELKDLDQARNNRFRLWGGSAAFQVFEQAGLLILTNGVLEKDRWSPNNWVRPMALEFAAEEDAIAFDGAPAAMPPPPNAMRNKAQASIGRGGAAGPQEIRVRKNFPETWLWEEVWMDKENFDVQKVVPDTLTSWIVTGYSLNSDAGIGVSLEPQVLQTFRPFFISLNLPYSVVKGEILSLQILVHNYLPEEVTATITLSNEDLHFDFGEEGAKKNTSMSKQVKVGPSQVTSATFVIVPSKFGVIMLKAKGVTATAGDALQQPLTVRPPGQKITKTKSSLVDLRAGSPKTYNLTTEFPQKRVEGADSVKIAVIADLLGTTISNLDKLLQMPCGCGEQNMLNFVPDIVILDYLTSTGKLTPAIKTKAVKFLESGYQRELTYRHSDGSFSAFGKSDLKGSTWLTAFVVRSFVAAKPYITVDDFIIQKALEFLSWQQQENGGFQELGRVLHSDMQGGSSSPGLALTAYTLLAFIESKDIIRSASNQTSAQYARTIANGLDYIASSKDASDVYALSLVAYTLQLANHPKKDEVFNTLKAKGTTEGDLLNWENPKLPPPPKDDIPNPEVPRILPWTPSEPRTKPVSVEMTSYALLNYLNRGLIDESLSIGKWLLKQRNAEGGFLSTQDTVVGLTALGQFAALTRAPETDIKVKADYGTGSREIIVNDENAIVLQEFYLPEATRFTDFIASGKGTALAQITWTYYVEDETAKPAFVVNVEAKTAGSKLRLNVCAAYVAGKLSNMAVVEVNLPSGYTFEAEDLEELRSIQTLKRYDLEDGDTKLVTYFDSIGQSKTCFKVSGLRVFNVRKQAPAYVLVYDYYDTTQTVRSFYDLPEGEDMDCRICSSNESDCDVSNCVS